jgi:hypothetical protein
MSDPLTDAYPSAPGAGAPPPAQGPPRQAADPTSEGTAGPGAPPTGSRPPGVSRHAPRFLAGDSWAGS